MRLLVFLVALCAATAASAQSCREIRFERGAFSGEVRGMAPPNDVVCYTIGTGIGQTMRIEVLRGNNVIFSVPGVADARTNLSIRTQQSRYTILVGQLFRSVTNEPFQVLVTIR